VPISDQLAEAVRLAQRIKAHGGRRRQLQYIGKLMRDEDAASIHKALERLDSASKHAMRVHHLCEQWRERLIEQGQGLQRSGCRRSYLGAPIPGTGRCGV